ncbi:hypothetical protein E7939_21830 [Salmonella enterica]|nr:hypothetical protein [Salmonella enterica]EAT8036368.1 hypothetical protein [Salmonella enterica]EAV6370512.1 hypothetical protein [Salmonella enterica]
MSKKKFVKIVAGTTGRYWWINTDQVTVIASNGDGCKVFYAGGGHLDLTELDADTLAKALGGGRGE